MAAPNSNHLVCSDFCYIKQLPPSLGLTAEAEESCRSHGTRQCCALVSDNLQPPPRLFRGFAASQMLLSRAAHRLPAPPVSSPSPGLPLNPYRHARANVFAGRRQRFWMVNRSGEAVSSLGRRFGYEGRLRRGGNTHLIRYSRRWRSLVRLARSHNPLDGRRGLFALVQVPVRLGAEGLSLKRLDYAQFSITIRAARLQSRHRIL